MSVLMQNLKVFFGFQDETDSRSLEIQRDPKSTANRPPVIRGFKGAIMNKTKTPVSEIKIEEPRIYEDSLNIATHLRENRPVIVNLKHLDSSSSKRLIDFICGTAYAINGHMMKIGENIFLFTPEEVLIIDPEEKASFDRSSMQNHQATPSMFFQPDAAQQ